MTVATDGSRSQQSANTSQTAIDHRASHYTTLVTPLALVKGRAPASRNNGLYLEPACTGMITDTGAEPTAPY